MSTLPRIDATVPEIADACLALLHVLGPVGREAVRKHCLANAEERMFSNLLKVMNDFERITEHRARTSTPDPSQ